MAISQRKISIDEIQNKLRIIHDNNVVLEPLTYKGMHIKAKFIDKDFGEWWSRPQSVIYQKTSHPKRGLLKISKHFTKNLDEVKKMLHEALGNSVTIKENTYKNLQSKCIFFDEDCGEWEALPYNVIHQKQRHPDRKILSRQETCLKKYGVTNVNKLQSIKDIKSKVFIQKYNVDHPMKNKDIALKCSKNANNSYILYHWKTNEELVCQASYEKKTVEWLNINKTEYRWQPQVFMMPNGKTYRPDLFLIKEDKWVEIKGYMRIHSKEKWDWFHATYLNSELWDKKKLKEIGIDVK